MTRHLRFLFILLTAWGCSLSIEQALNLHASARAQDSSRSARSDGESREERRRRYFSERGDRGSSDRSDRYRGYRSRDEERRSEDRSSSSNSSSPSSTTSTTPTTSSATTPTTTPSTQSTSAGMNIKDYAVKLVTRYDKNGDMMLGPDERKELRGPAADSDLNHDGVITVDELVAHLSNPSATTSTTPSTSSSTTPTTSASNSSGDRERERDRGGYGYRHHESDSNSDRGKSDADKALAGRVFTGTAGGGAATTKEGDKRRTYRFSRPADKIPASVPSWFKSRDTNGDGQVSMSEYSRSWSESTVLEFRRYDLNDDGIITAKEAAAKK